MPTVRPSKGNTTKLRPGDELVLVRRRFTLKTDEETLEQTTEHEDAVISAVRCPEDVEIYGGEMFSEFDDEKKFIIIKLLSRNVTS